MSGTIVPNRNPDFGLPAGVPLSIDELRVDPSRMPLVQDRSDYYRGSPTPFAYNHGRGSLIAAADNQPSGVGRVSAQTNSAEVAGRT